MNTEWIYLALYGLMMIVCCYHMMRMMKSNASEQADTERARAEAACVDAETADALPSKTN